MIEGVYEQDLVRLDLPIAIPSPIGSKTQGSPDQGVALNSGPLLFIRIV